MITKDSILELGFFEDKDIILGDVLISATTYKVPIKKKASKSNFGVFTGVEGTNKNMLHARFILREVKDDEGIWFVYDAKTLDRDYISEPDKLLKFLERD